MPPDNPTPGLYETIHRRRDVRAEFNGGPIDEAALSRVLDAAHAAPSVGMSQPWDFILVRRADTKEAFLGHVIEEREKFAASLEADRARVFDSIKIEGILESSLSIVVTYDPQRGGPAVLGRHSISDAGLYSVCLSIQNMWLAATAEGWGLGWVSFYREDFLARLLDVPDGVRPVAWLCVGPVDHLAEVPDLERLGWRGRRAVNEAVHEDRW
ncbi:MAG: 5,6-dimethylbenzimidazole synthase [Acidimicrobiales bacterium]